MIAEHFDYFLLIFEHCCLQLKCFSRWWETRKNKNIALGSGQFLFLLEWKNVESVFRPLFSPRYLETRNVDIIMRLVSVDMGAGKTIFMNPNSELIYDIWVHNKSMWNKCSEDSFAMCDDRIMPMRNLNTRLNPVTNVEIKNRNRRIISNRTPLCDM